VVIEPEKPRVWRWLLRQDLSGVFSCSSLLKDAAEKCLLKDPISASGYTQANVNAVWNYVMMQHEEHMARGLSPSFAVYSESSKNWLLYPIAPKLTGAARRRALRIRARPSFLRMIDTLTDREYEALSCILLEALGCIHVQLTRRGSEGGIDAFGLMVKANTSHLIASNRQPIRIVVQAKKYRRPMPADKMKEFLQTLNEVRHGGQTKTEAVTPPWFREARGPMIGLVLSHSGYQSGAESRGRSHGVLMADSVDAAEILAASRTLYGKTEYARLQACMDQAKSLVAESDKAGGST